MMHVVGLVAELSLLGISVAGIVLLLRDAK